jgi:outer membrane immunogenic protein
LLNGVTFAVLVAGPAMAADLGRPVYRKPAVAVAVNTWTGFYVGGNVGYSWGDAYTDIAGSAQTSTFSLFPANVGFASSDTARLNGVIVGSDRLNCDPLDHSVNGSCPSSDQ